MDGAVCILDGVAGVEAQTEKVWQQAARYKIPKIIYINKLDRDGAAFGKTVREIASGLHTWPAVCQIPMFRSKGEGFYGVGDVINLQAFQWNDGGDGKQVECLSLESLEHSKPEFCGELKKARAALIELLSSYDDEMVQRYLESDEDHLKVSATDIVSSLRRCTLDSSSNIVAVFVGASLRNIGVQPLLNAVVDLLPSPKETPDPDISLGGSDGTLLKLLEGEMAVELQQPKTGKKQVVARRSSAPCAQNLEACALAFKVVNDPRQGALVYVRVYSGSIKRGSILFNTNLHLSERAPRLFKMLASDPVDIQDLSAGQIGVIPGLKHTRTGDTLVSYTGVNSQKGPPAPLDSLQLRPIDVPPAMFFSSVEPHSQGEEQPVKDALAMLVREDPSLQLSVEPDSGQTLLSGMGEFHLEIARDRLVNDLKAKAELGKIEIAYRESILTGSSPQVVEFDRQTVGRRGRAGCIATVSPFVDEKSFEDESWDEYSYTLMEDSNRINTSIEGHSEKSNLEPWSGHLPAHLSAPVIHSSLQMGALAALSRGVNHGFRLTYTRVSLTIDPRTDIFGSETTPAALRSAARIATQTALVKAAQAGGSALMESVMNVTITCDAASFGAVMNDISSARGGHVISLDEGDPSSTSLDLPLIDVSKVYAPPDSFTALITEGSQESADGSQGSGTRTIQATVPLEQMVGYLKHLNSITGGRGAFVMSPDRFERVVGQREKQLLKKLKGY